MAFEITSNLKSKKYPEKIPYKKIKDFVLGNSYELSLVFIGDKLSQKLNSEFRGVCKPTDVLTFPISDDMGEIFINLSYSEKTAKKFDREKDNFVAFLFIHGLAHILGYDHEDDFDAEDMEKFEKKIRKKFKI
ncbi:MAG TPA: rRNA maturation RNase YbeY [Bacteroidia bacterium]|nr:rRNA maturation RNase YbeY [Bacteroidia bacterium]